MSDHLPKMVANRAAIAVDRLPATQHLNLRLSLPLRDREGLKTLIEQQYDPQSPLYRQLSVEEFTARFGPDETAYSTVIDFAKRNGLSVTSLAPNRMLVDVDGTVERTFHVTMRF